MSITSRRIQDPTNGRYMVIYSHKPGEEIFAHPKAAGTSIPLVIFSKSSIQLLAPATPIPFIIPVNALSLALNLDFYLHYLSPLKLVVNFGYRNNFPFKSGMVLNRRTSKVTYP